MRAYETDKIVIFNFVKNCLVGAKMGCIEENQSNYIVYTMRFEYLFEHTAGKIKVFGTCFKKIATCCSFQNTQLDS